MDSMETISCFELNWSIRMIDNITIGVSWSIVLIGLMFKFNEWQMECDIRVCTFSRMAKSPVGRVFILSNYFKITKSFLVTVLCKTYIQLSGNVNSFHYMESPLNLIHKENNIQAIVCLWWKRHMWTEWLLSVFLPYTSRIH